MLARTPKDIGLIIRSRRKALGWDQAHLAKSAGVSRQWLIDAEKGKPRAELRLILQTINTLGLSLHASSTELAKQDNEPRPTDPDTPANRESSSENEGTAELSKLASGLCEEMEQALSEASGAFPNAADEARSLASIGHSELDKHLTGGMPDDLHALMRLQHGAAELAKLVSILPEEMGAQWRSATTSINERSKLLESDPLSLHRGKKR